MDLNTILAHILIWGVAGGVLLTAFVLIQHASGMVDRIYGKHAGNAAHLRALGLRLLAVTVALLFAVPFAADLALAAAVGSAPSFGVYWGVGFSVVLVMHVWDFLVVDLLFVLSLRPRFLSLPDVEYYRSVTPHLRALVKGVALGLVTTLLAAGAASLLT